MTLTLCGIKPQNAQQHQALELGQAFLNSRDPNRRIFKTTGYAGSGKSTIAFALAADQVGQSKRIAFTAPTHKALNVGRKIAASRGLTHIDFHTIHSLLGLSMAKVDGEKRLQSTGTNSTFLYDVVWLDECSMVGQDLWGFVQASFSAETRSLHHPTKLMLIGDPAQLYPVGEGKSPTFSRELEGINLTEVVRQQQGSSLLDFVTQARRAVTRKAENYRPFRPRGISADPKPEGVILTSKKRVLNLACKNLEKFDRDPDRFRILAWRNAQVDEYNTAIRQYRYGANAPRFVVGERLITRDPLLAPDKRTILVQTSTECVVREIEEAVYGHYKCWQLQVELEGTEEQKQIYALHEDDQARFDAETQRLATAARRSSFLWRLYFEHLETYAQVRPCYALTVHNSQGSTFTQVAVDGGDIAKRLYSQEGESELKAMREHNRLWYVATSRASKRLFVVG